MIFSMDEQTNRFTIYENFLNKKRCIALLIFNYLTEGNISKSFLVDGRTYHLRTDIYDSLLLLVHQRKPSAPLSILIKEMSNNYQSLSIGHPIIFFESLLEQKDNVLRSFYQLPNDFRQIDTENTFTYLLNRARGCTELCPYCRRPCDIDHIQIGSLFSSHFIKHACETGHGFHAMTGRKYGESDEASLVICDQIHDDHHHHIISMGDTSIIPFELDFSIEIKWRTNRSITKSMVNHLEYSRRRDLSKISDEIR